MVVSNGHPGEFSGFRTAPDSGYGYDHYSPYPPDAFSEAYSAEYLPGASEAAGYTATPPYGVPFDRGDGLYGGNHQGQYGWPEQYGGGHTDSYAPHPTPYPYSYPAEHPSPAEPPGGPAPTHAYAPDPFLDPYTSWEGVAQQAAPYPAGTDHPSAVHPHPEQAPGGYQQYAPYPDYDAYGPYASHGSYDPYDTPPAGQQYVPWYPPEPTAEQQFHDPAQDVPHATDVAPPEPGFPEPFPGDAELDEAEPEPADGPDDSDAPDIRDDPDSPDDPVDPDGGAQRGGAPHNRRAATRIAIPSIAVVGVAAVAAVTVGQNNAESRQESQQPTAASAQDEPADEAPRVSSKSAEASSKSALDLRLAHVSEDVHKFTDRASRTQTRLALQEREKELKKKRAEKKRRKEAMRPKHAVPFTQHIGLSATFGSSGAHWMSLHTGIDFPVSAGTPVHAATDGTVRSQFNSAYGNMVIVTAEDGTETWYCHLSSAKIRSGSVQAGDVIAYSGSSGNSTGPHMHFEVHPQGGSASDPVPWFRQYGLDPS